MARLQHLPHPGAGGAGRALCAATFADVAFFTNSGTEAMECALKMARKYHWANGEPERIDIIGFDGAFHGRSYAAVFAAGNPTYVEGFGPALPGYISLPFGDMDALKRGGRPTRRRRSSSSRCRAKAARGRSAGAASPPCASIATRPACC